jgi:hypothetical protein
MERRNKELHPLLFDSDELSTTRQSSRIIEMEPSKTPERELFIENVENSEREVMGTEGQEEITGYRLGKVNMILDKV